MKWTRTDKYAESSDCNRYAVCAIGFEREGDHGFFEAWRRRSHPDGPHLIATNLATAAEARALCEQDAAE